MNDSTRFTLAKTSVIVAGIAGILSLTGCSSEQSTVSGRLDDTKYVKSVKAVPAETHTETRREKTKKSCTGTGVKRECKTVDDGYKTVTVTVTDKPGRAWKSGMYCVELDDVNGQRSNDDQWYAVSASTYHKWADKEEGVKVKSMPYDRELHSCKR